MGSRVAPTSLDRDEASELWAAHPLAAVAPIIRHCLAGIADESEHLVVVSDAAVEKPEAGTTVTAGYRETKRVNAASRTWPSRS